MVRMPLPTRLKSHSSKNGTDTSGQDISRSSSPLRGMLSQESKGLVLKTIVLRGRNLAAKDKGGTSDPYLVLTLGESRQSTPAISKTLNPEWNVGFDLPVEDLQSLILEAVCWDKDRLGKDYLGEFDVALEDIFQDGKAEQMPRWYPLKSKRKGTKKKDVSGEVLLQFTLEDHSSQSPSPNDAVSRLMSIATITPSEEVSENGDLGKVSSPDRDDDEDEDDEDDEPDTSDETDDLMKPGESEKKRRRKLRLAKIKRKTKARAYEFTGDSDIVGMVFLEVSRITDLPPERNMTRTSFDMDPFVVVSLGKKTYRTRCVSHNLNPIFDEKMVFQVLRHEQSFTLSFTVVDRDKLTGNDFVGTTALELQEITSTAPEADPNTGLYKLPEPPEAMAVPAPSKSRFKIPLSRSSSAQSLKNLGKPSLKSQNSSASIMNSQGTGEQVHNGQPGDGTYLAPVASSPVGEGGDEECGHGDDPDLKTWNLTIQLKNKDRWEAKHNPQLHIKAKYLPYNALRQQFWRAMLRQYDSDENRQVSKVELTTMLDTLGSTLKETTIDSFFGRFAKADEPGTPFDLSFDQAVMALEDQLQQSTAKRSIGDNIKSHLPNAHFATTRTSGKLSANPDQTPTNGTPGLSLNKDPDQSSVPAIVQDHTGSPGESGDFLERDDLTDERGEEHVVEIRECPLCHQPRLNKKSDADIITHIATCASQDWRQINNIVMAGFVTSSQAQRKWYSKVITKISYGGYKLGANSANILVQDRLTGQINEERMSVYVRLGIRLLYKGLKSRDMEKKRIRKLLRSLSFKQGRKYDDPASAREIEGFVNFHKLNMDEVLRPIDQFKNFNEFFYRELKPGARPCSAPDDPRIIVSPADSRSVVFNTIGNATQVWVKGREFSIQRLLGNAYPEDVSRFENGALGIFRLAPQDYHRFHIPVDGILDKPKLIEGEYYTVNPMAIRSALDVYGENIRYIVPINSEAHGRVMVVCIGAMMVGSTVITRKPGERVHRAEELGYFKFGGSTLILLFEPGRMAWDDDIVDNANSAVETLVRVGMSVGHHPGQPQFAPDMPKKDENVTQEERQEAKRRIEGSMAPEAVPSGPGGMK